jgi:arginyl-tRNA synthetase
VSFDEDQDFRERSRRRVVLLQSGDADTLRLWRILVAESVRYFDEVYTKLGVLLSDDDIVGESFYNPMLPGVVADLGALGLLVENEGALCVFPPGFENRHGEPLPLIVQKSDDGFGYAATDLAALRDRVERLGATRILYVVGAPQAQHLEMCFAVARMAGWLSEPVEVVHVAFGSVLGADRKMLRSRSGDSVKLVDLIDEAVERAGAAVEERDLVQAADVGEQIARMLGVGAIKYADLSTDRTRDYVFDWDRMLAFEGNTGPYLQYAYARICSIFRRAGIDRPWTVASGSDAIATPRLVEREERSLALALLGFDEAVQLSSQTCSPSKLCSYLLDLASAFTTFYEACPVLKAPAQMRGSRLLLADVTARVLAQGLALLGIEAPEQM